MRYLDKRKIKYVIYAGAGILCFLIGGMIYLKFQHRIFYKYIWGSARNVGKPCTNIDVYADGQLTHAVKAFKVSSYWDGGKANYTILTLDNPVADSTGYKVLLVNYDHNFIGLPVSTNEADYKMSFGSLLQSDLDEKAILINNDIKGFGIDPKMEVRKNETKFLLDKSRMGIDSIRMVYK